MSSIIPLPEDLVGIHLRERQVRPRDVGFTAKTQ
jgi:hypothetical protein